MYEISWGSRSTPAATEDLYNEHGYIYVHTNKYGGVKSW